MPRVFSSTGFHLIFTRFPLVQNVNLLRAKASVLQDYYLPNKEGIKFTSKK